MFDDIIGIEKGKKSNRCDCCGKEIPKKSIKSSGGNIFCSFACAICYASTKMAEKQQTVTSANPVGHGTTAPASE